MDGNVRLPTLDEMFDWSFQGTLSPRISLGEAPRGDAEDEDQDGTPTARAIGITTLVVVDLMVTMI